MEELKYIALGLMLSWPIGYIIYTICKNINELEDAIELSNQKIFELEDDIESLKRRIFELEDELEKLKKYD